MAENEHHATGEYRIRQVVGAARAWRTEAARESGDGAGAPSTERAAAWCGEMKRTKMNVRSGRVFIGNRYEVVYMPPQGERRLRDMLEDLWRFTAAPSGDPIVRMAMAHHQFESIHPFEDGNGRTGRLLNAVLLHRSGVAGSRLAAPSAGILEPGGGSTTRACGRRPPRAIGKGGWCSSRGHSRPGPRTRGRPGGGTRPMPAG